MKGQQLWLLKDSMVISGEYINNVLTFVRRMRTNKEVKYRKQKTSTRMTMSLDPAGAFRGRVHAKLCPTIEILENNNI